MKRILVITNNLKQASFRLRVESLVDLLRQRGFDLHIHVRPRGLLARRRLLRSADRYDSVLLQRKLLDPSDARLLRCRSRHIFFDVDDAVMYHNRPVGAIEQWRTHRRFIATARHVDRVVAGNEYLAGLFGREGASVTIIPTVVDPDHYRIKTHAAVTAPCLVWIGSHSTLLYLQQLAPAMAEAAKLVPGLRLVTIADKTLDRCPIPLDHIPWTAEAEAAALCRGDIGIAPTPIDRWTLGKCAFKVVQYMAAGLPVIASPVGANAQIVQAGITGLLPESLVDWPAAIATLATDADLRARMGRAGRDLVETRYSLTHAADIWRACSMEKNHPAHKY